MKKRILSLILALSMVLSVLPLGAFAAPTLPELVMKNGLPDLTGLTPLQGGKYIGDNWGYDSNTGTLSLTYGTFDFSSTHPQGKTPGTSTTTPVACPIVIESGVTITGGTFDGGVFNSGTITKRAITDSTFNGVVTNNAGGTISGGTFNATVTNNAGGTISKGAFKSSVENNALGTIAGGTFQSGCSVKNYGTIKDNGTFEGTVENSGTIENGTFEGTVENYGTIKNGTFTYDVINYNADDAISSSSGTIENGTFMGDVENKSDGTIADGTFASGKTVTNYGTIKNGTFNGTVDNCGSGKISGGTFAAGLSVKNGSVTGGVFNGDINVTTGAGVYPITVDEASPGAKIEKVNGVPAEWDPHVVIDGDVLPEVTITASTKIYSLNGESLSTNPYSSSQDSSDQNTVKFKMPKEGVTIGCGGLIMKNGLPDITGMSATQDGSYTVYIGDGWKYSVKSGSTGTGTLYLNSGSYDFSYTKPKTKAGGSAEQPVQCDIKLASADVTITGGKFEYTVMNSNGGTISGGTFKSSVYSYNGHIIGGVFRGKTTSKPTQDAYTITLDTANAKITEVNGVSADWDPYPYVVVTASTQNQVVTITASTEIFSLNDKSIGAGNCNSSYGSGNNIVTFTMPDEPVVLSGAITCTNLVMKGGYPEASNGGTTPCKGNGWTYSKKDTSNPKGKLTLTDGTYDFSYTYPQNSNGAGAEPVACAVETQLRVEITGGTFEGEVINNDLGVISGGTFHEKVSNCNGMITGGTFKSSVTSKGHGRIFGGVFNGNATLTNVTGLHSITVASGAKIKEVNGMSADWDPYVVVTENATTNEVIITADTEIFSLNGKSIGDGNCKSSYDGSDYKTVKFTMPDTNVVLNGAITCTDLVMEKGWPEASNEGKISCKGNGWEYSKKDASNPAGKLTLTDGTFDFSSTAPVKCEILLDSENAKITGGTFEADVKNNNGGTISDGTFNGTVENYGGKISSGTFKGTVQHWYGTISGGTFHEKVLNSHGEITGGTFAAGLSANDGAVTGGVFNGNAYITGVTGLHSIKWDDDYSKANTNAKIEKVNGVSANWAPYVVVTELTTATAKEVTITADTEIFSLNGQLLGADDRVNGNKNTVKFTMPDDMPDNENVVLNKAITSTDLVMEKGWPKDSNGGTIPCKGDGWEYIKNDPTNGDMLLLTGSSQTGGLFDFSTIGDGSPVECNVFVGKPTAITGGEFDGKVINNSHILGGTFHGEVDNMGPGRIENGTFKNSVENNGMIENGTFEGTVENNTNGTISDGTFAGSVSNNGGTVNGGVFNGNTGLDGVTDLHSITVASGAKIEKVNGVPAEWAPYVVTSNATTKEVTITADTEIFSLNGQPIAESSYGVDKKTVTFTMPDDDVVLNGELITKPEPEPKPEPKPEPEPEPTTYTVTVIGGTIDGKTSVSAKENDTLTVVLDQNDIPDGMTFDLWSISSDKLSGDINVDYRAEAMTFQMPAEDVTIRAQYRSAEIIEDAAPSPLATAATIAVGGAAAGIVVWQGVSLGVDLYLANALPQGVPVPTDRRALALLLWETAGKPEVALPTLYGDVPAEEIELQKATHWAVQNGLMDAADKKDASFFDPDHYVTKMDVFGAWLRLKKLLGTT